MADRCADPACNLGEHDSQTPHGTPAPPDDAPCDCGCGTTPWRSCPNYHRIDDLPFATVKGLAAGIGVSLTSPRRAS